MIKLKNLLIEVVSKSEVTKLMLLKNPKTIQAEYVRVDGKKLKEKSVSKEPKILTSKEIKKKTWDVKIN